MAGGAVAAIVLVTIPVVTSAQLLNTNSNCKATIKSGWNLMSVPSLACVAFAMGSAGGTSIEKFPSYLDIYAYDGSKYLYTKVTRQNFRGDAIEKGIEKYAENILKKITNGQITKLDNDFERYFENDFKQNDQQKIKEYAGRAAKEVFTSVWVYNPGRDYVVNFTGKDHGEIALANVLSSNVSDAEINNFLDQADREIVPDMIGEINRMPAGYRTFLNASLSGGLILDSGWSFLSYNKLIVDNLGKLNFTKGNCQITKAYVFDNDAKKWIEAGSVNPSMMGAGVVVYNSGSKCNLLIENRIVSRLKEMVGGTTNSGSMLPPQMPN